MGGTSAHTPFIIFTHVEVHGGFNIILDLEDKNLVTNRWSIFTNILYLLSNSVIK